MEFNSQICTTKEQSERLLALGLRPETADCILVQNPFSIDEYVMFPRATDDTGDIDSTTDIPAWSLDRLLEIAKGNGVHNFMECNRYDDVIALIQSYIHLGYINEEYLTQ